MSNVMKKLEGTNKLLFAIPLKPVQGHRFQPTGFPSLGAATFQTKEGMGLLVESPQSMANRLEAACWDEASAELLPALKGLSYIRVERTGKDGKRSYFTSSITEAHRLNSPYLLEGKDKSFFNELKEALGGLESGPIDRRALAQTLLKYDVNCLLHGIFLAKKELAGGRLRIARAISAFIEADEVKQAISGGVKNDHVNPSGSTKEGFGNVPFSREEFTAGRITLYVNIDLGQIRGFGLGQDVEELLVVLALFKLRALVDGSLRLRTACDLEVAVETVETARPVGFVLPDLAELEVAVKSAIEACKDRMKVTTVEFNDELKKGSDKEESEKGEDEGSN